MYRTMSSSGKHSDHATVSQALAELRKYIWTPACVNEEAVQTALDSGKDFTVEYGFTQAWISRVH